MLSRLTSALIQHCDFRHVVSFYGVEIETRGLSNHYFVFMEYCPEGTLRAMIESWGFERYATPCPCDSASRELVLRRFPLYMYFFGICTRRWALAVCTQLLRVSCVRTCACACGLSLCAFSCCIFQVRLYAHVQFSLHSAIRLSVCSAYILFMLMCR